MPVLTVVVMGGVSPEVTAVVAVTMLPKIRIMVLSLEVVLEIVVIVAVLIVQW